MPLDYEDIEIVKGSGFNYRFFSRFPATRMYEFNYALNNLCKKVIYNAMIDNQELNDNKLGYQMVPSKAARAWLLRDGFEVPAVISFLCTWIVQPLDEKAPPALDALLEADESTSGSWADEEVTKETPKTLSGLLNFIIERDLERKAGLNLLKLFFIKLNTPTSLIEQKPTNTTGSTEKAGRGKKPVSVKAQPSA